MPVTNDTEGGVAKRSLTVDQIFGLVGFSTAFLPHPVALLTIEQAANRAGVPKTTVDSAVEGSNHFRELVVCHVIDGLAIEPGEATWAALRAGLRAASSQEALAGLIDARATELANDPAFTIFLGGFDCLGKSRIAAAVNAAAVGIVRHFIPFVETVVATLDDEVESSIDPDAALLILHVLLTESYRRLRGFPRPDPSVEALITAQSAALVLDEIHTRTDDTAGYRWDAFFAMPSGYVDPPGGRLGLAVRAGADLLIDGAVPLSMRLTVNDVTAATGMSVATFYRRFGSIGELERVLLDCVGNDIITCYQDAFFDDLLEGIRSGGLSTAEALSLFMEQGAGTVAEHVTSGRPDRQTIPWMQTDFVADAFRSAYQQGFALRGSFYEEFSSILGRSIADGLDGSIVAAVLNAHSIISELLIRNAPDRDAASGVMQSRFPRINARLFI